MQASCGIFLIAAPFVGDGGWPSEDMPPPDFVTPRAAVSDELPPLFGDVAGSGHAGRSVPYY
jgi:hypothetical protein